ncbi:MAG: xanthine dehydrogenase family protein molybdopterin-binding subunit [Rhodobacteraceae bacterium]|nr:xanthine dehydrogenase family protein molybdopterin-binding subunit [Paracoccaceae bacterium]
MTDVFDKRREDPRLLKGEGRYLSDCIGPEGRFAGFLRSPLASGRIVTLDIAAAREIPGVAAIFTGQDLREAGVGPIEHTPMSRDDGGAPGQFPQPILSEDVIRHIGEPIAIVVADTEAAVADAIEAIVVDFDAAEPVSGLAFCKRLGDRATTDGIIAAAPHVARVQVDLPRVTAMALEPRGGIARVDGQGRLHYRSSTQNPFAMRAQLAAQLFWGEGDIHVVAQDVGGSFGLKGFMTREDAALCWAARKLGGEIAWRSTRSEAMLGDAQGRGARASVTVALDEDLSILALDADFVVDVGAYPSRRSQGVANNINGMTGVYHIPSVSVEIRGELSNRAPLAPFRGNGRPEATYAIERVLDGAARQIGVDPVELRERNLVHPSQMPATTGLGTVIDCGDFPAVMEKALALGAGREARRAEAEARGRLHGFGLANCIESAGGPLRQPKPDFARVTIEGDGTVILAPGVMSVGQGHETSLARMVAERLEIEPGAIRYHQGDTEAISFGRGSGGSSGLTVAGSALWQVLDEIQDEGRKAAARQLGCDGAELAFREGVFHREGSNENVTLAGLAAAQPEGRWVVERGFTPDAATFPNGTHICEVEIDPETGKVEITRYFAVEDVGRVLSPRLVDGQLHGGIAQGLSLGLGERMEFDESGQILSGTLMDYAVVRASDLPAFQLASFEVPTQMNPLGVKGVGEAGAVGATAALASAVTDALHRVGVSDFELPATPDRVWAALAKARVG